MANNCHTTLFQERLLIQFHYILIATLEKKYLLALRKRKKIRRTILNKYYVKTKNTNLSIINTKKKNEERKRQDLRKKHNCCIPKMM